MTLPLAWSHPIIADGLFIYGTLREGGAHHAWLKRTQPQGSCRAWLAGRLFHLPLEGYPALVPVPEPDTPPPSPGWVTGEFVGYDDDADLEAALADLDQVEGVEEELFLRTTLPVVLDGGQRFVAWVYVFPEDRLLTLERHATELVDGDWGRYLGDGFL
ncbi:MAG: gamma-glutamylcyclotransferase [Holophaga sp.]|nr:gamma-glutamylcyclotransferase [Holophaga sp.]